MENDSFSFEVFIYGVPKGICRKMIEEAFRLYNEKYEDEMNESWNDEFMEVFTSLIQPLLDETITLEEIYNQ
jgi:hypothetical protein